MDSKDLDGGGGADSSHGGSLPGGGGGGGQYSSKSIPNTSSNTGGGPEGNNGGTVSGGNGGIGSGNNNGGKGNQLMGKVKSVHAAIKKRVGRSVPPSPVLRVPNNSTGLAGRGPGRKSTRSSLRGTTGLSPASRPVITTQGSTDLVGVPSSPNASGGGGGLSGATCQPVPLPGGHNLFEYHPGPGTSSGAAGAGGVAGVGPGGHPPSFRESMRSRQSYAASSPGPAASVYSFTLKPQDSLDGTDALSMRSRRSTASQRLRNGSVLPSVISSEQRQSRPDLFCRSDGLAPPDTPTGSLGSSTTGGGTASTKELQERPVTFSEFLELYKAFMIRMRKDIREVFNQHCSTTNNPSVVGVVQKTATSRTERGSICKDSGLGSNTIDSPSSNPQQQHQSAGLSKQASLLASTKFYGSDALTRNVGQSLPEKQHKIYNALALASVNQNQTVDTSRSAWLNPTALKNFIQTHQLEPCDDADAIRIIQEHEPDPGMRARQQLSYEGFARYLLDSRNFAFVPEDSAPTQEELSYPLSYYFIASSHNTYLTGHQLKGDSSAELYRQVLVSGCRCVELDCWDGDNGNPVIYHGHTFTTKIRFRRAIEIIKKSAFETSNLPVILSIENHCSIPQQTIMAQMFKNVFGDDLVTNFMFESDFSASPQLPSPSQLQRKILIKFKKLNFEPQPPMTTTMIAPDEKKKIERKCSKNSFTSSTGDEDDEIDESDEDEDIDELYTAGKDSPALSGSTAGRTAGRTADGSDGGGGSTAKARRSTARTSQKDSFSSESDVGGVTTIASSGVTTTTTSNSGGGKASADEQSQSQQTTAHQQQQHATSQPIPIPTTTSKTQHQQQQQTPAATSNIFVTQQKRGVGIARELSDLVVYCQSVKYKNFSDVLTDESTSQYLANMAGSSGVGGIDNPALFGGGIRSIGSTASVDSVATGVSSVTFSSSVGGGYVAVDQNPSSSVSPSPVGVSFGIGSPSPSSGLENQRSGSTAGAGAAGPSPILTSPRISNIRTAAERKSVRKLTAPIGSVMSTNNSNHNNNSSSSGGNLLAVPSSSSKTHRSGGGSSGDGGGGAACINRRTPTRSSCYQVASLNETTAKKLCRKHPNRMIAYSREHMVRTYPAGMRIDSSNFNPVQFWTHGIQMVALNYQTADISMAINTALFEQNGSCGYILKPRVLWDREHAAFNAFNPWNVKEWTSKEVPSGGIPPMHITLTVISGQHLTSGGGNPLVEVEVLGIPPDCEKYRTKPILRNTVNPIWNQTFEFRVSFVELAFLRLSIIDSASTGSGKLIAQRVIPLRSLKPGYRHCRLRAVNNVALDHSTLFLYSRSEELEYVNVDEADSGGGVGVSGESKIPANPPPQTSSAGFQTNSTATTSSVSSSSGTTPSTVVGGVNNAVGGSVSATGKLAAKKDGVGREICPVLRRQVFVLKIYGFALFDGHVNVNAEWKTPVREVIQRSLHACGRSNESPDEYLIVEERIMPAATTTIIQPPPTTTTASSGVTTNSTTSTSITTTTGTSTTKPPSSPSSSTNVLAGIGQSPALSATTTTIASSTMTPQQQQQQQSTESVNVGEKEAHDKLTQSESLTTRQRILAADELVMDSVASWMGQRAARFVLKKKGNDPSTRAWISTIIKSSGGREGSSSSMIAGGSVLPSNSSGLSRPRSRTGASSITDCEDDSSWWGGSRERAFTHSTFLVCVHNVSAAQPYAILRAAINSTAGDIIVQVLLKARRMEGPEEFVLLEECGGLEETSLGDNPSSSAASATQSGGAKTSVDQSASSAGGGGGGGSSLQNPSNFQSSSNNPTSSTGTHSSSSTGSSAAQTFRQTLKSMRTPQWLTQQSRERSPSAASRTSLRSQQTKTVRVVQTHENIYTLQNHWKGTSRFVLSLRSEWDATQPSSDQQSSKDHQQKTAASGKPETSPKNRKKSLVTMRSLNFGKAKKSVAE